MRRLRAGVLAELGVAAVVLSVAAVLVATVPARTVAQQSVLAAQAARHAGHAHQHAVFQSHVTTFDGGAATLTVLVAPGHVGVNAMYLELREQAGVLLAANEVDAVVALPALRLGPLPAPLRSAGPGHYMTPALRLPSAGTWQLLVTIRFTTGIRTVTVPVVIT